MNALAASSSSLAGVRVQARAQGPRARTSPVVRCQAVNDDSRRQIEDLTAKSAASKELHDKQRLATSYANLARSRTVADGTCKFPENIFGCQTKVTGPVKYFAEDLALECQGKPEAKCNSHMQARSIPKAFS